MPGAGYAIQRPTRTGCATATPGQDAWTAPFIANQSYRRFARVTMAETTSQLRSRAPATALRAAGLDLAALMRDAWRSKSPENNSARGDRDHVLACRSVMTEL